MSHPTADGAADAALERFLDDTRDARLESFKALLRIPSISGIPAYAPDCRAAAEFVATDLRAAGVEHIEVSETGGHPAAVGFWTQAEPDAPRVLLYGHYDVQPVEPLDLWLCDPFAAEVRDRDVFDKPVPGGVLIARGSADNKGQHLAMLAGALRGSRNVPREWMRLFRPPALERIRHNAGRLTDLVAVVTPHGVVELSAIFIAGGAGLMLGHAIIDPGDRLRRDAIVHASREAVKLAVGTVPMFVCAGLIEGLISPQYEGLFASNAARIAFGWLMGGAWFLYLFAGDHVIAAMRGKQGAVGLDSG